MTTSPGQVLGGQLSVPLYDLCIANRWSPFARGFLGPTLCPPSGHSHKSLSLHPKPEESFSLITGHWLSQLTLMATGYLSWGKPQQLLFLGHLEHTWPCMWPPGTAYLLFCCWPYSGKGIGKKRMSETCSRKAVFSKSSSLQLFLSISWKTSTL